MCMMVLLGRVDVNPSIGGIFGQTLLSFVATRRCGVLWGREVGL